MPTVTFSIETTEILSERNKKQETVTINVTTQGIDVATPKAADYLAGMVKELAPQIIETVNKAYLARVVPDYEILSSSIQKAH